MGARVDPAIEGLLRERKIQRLRASRETILKELEGADYGMVFSEQGTRTLIINADKFLRKAVETLEL